MADKIKKRVVKKFKNKKNKDVIQIPKAFRQSYLSGAENEKIIDAPHPGHPGDI